MHIIEVCASVYLSLPIDSTVLSQETCVHPVYRTGLETVVDDVVVVALVEAQISSLSRVSEQRLNNNFAFPEFMGKQWKTHLMVTV